MKTAPKIMLGYCLIACFVAGVGYVGYWSARQTELSYGDMAKNTFPIAEALQKVRYYGMRVNSSTAELLFLRTLGEDAIETGLNHGASEEELRNKTLALLDQALDLYIDTVRRRHPHEIEQANRIRQLGVEFKAGSAEILALQKSGAQSALLLEAKVRMEDAESSFFSAIDEALRREEQKLLDMPQAMDAAIEGYIGTISGVSLLSFAAALVLGMLIARSLSRPIIALRDSIPALGKGDLGARVDIRSRNEVGTVAQSFNDMAQALSATAVSKAEMDNIIRSMPDSLIVLDIEGRILRVNQSTLRLLGYTEAELVGQPAGLIVQDDFLPNFRAGDYAAYAVDESTETVYRKKDGGLQPVQFTAAVVRNETGEIQGLVLVAQGSSDLKEAQEKLIRKTQELERTNRELDQFAYVVSHDLKAPLRAIANLSQWIEEDLSDKMPPDTRNQMDLLRGRVQRMEGLINAVLEYSRVGRVAAQIEEIDTQALLNDIIDGLPVPPGYTISAGPGMPRFATARVYLGQVFGNLLSNAIKYRVRDDGRATVSVADLGDYYEFAVSDDGVGIAPEYHEKVFVIFQTLAARDKIDSTGIGLTLVKKIVEGVGGHVTLESKEGQGATFRFTWPKTIEERTAA